MNERVLLEILQDGEDIVVRDRSGNELCRNSYIGVGNVNDAVSATVRIALINWRLMGNGPLVRNQANG